jgi:hypothetical protein
MFDWLKDQLHFLHHKWFFRNVKPGEYIATCHGTHERVTSVTKSGDLKVAVTWNGSYVILSHCCTGDDIPASTMSPANMHSWMNHRCVRSYQFYHQEQVND